MSGPENPTGDTTLPRPLLTGTDIPYRLTMLSDWHAGTGAGRPGDVDRLVIRDEDGLPFVPAKSMTGLWRDACEIAARALDRQRPDDDWASWVEVAFGSQPGLGGSRDRDRDRPRPAALEVRRARYSPGLRAAVRDSGDLVRATTFVKPGVKIDTVSGRAVPGMLRMEEVARVGTVLHGTFRLDADLLGDEDALRRVSAILLAGSRLVEQIGGKRRRGNGRCLFALSRPDLDEWWSWLLTAPPRRAEPPGLAPRVLPGPERAQPASGWEIARLDMLLEDPVLAGGRVIGNRVLGQDRIPGGRLIPGILNRLGTAAADALAAGHLIITDATVAIGGEPGRPVPRTFAVLKDRAAPRPLVNRALAPPSNGKTVKEGFVAPAPPLRLVRPAMVTRMHNSVDDITQRPTADAGGGVFTYQALAAGTAMVAEVRVRAGLLPPGWMEKLTGTYRLGRSRKDDYGRVSVQAHAAEPAPVRAQAKRGSRLTVWLVSDLLLLDQRLRPTSDPGQLGRALAVALGLPEASLGEPVMDDERAVSVLGTRRSESWQARWGLPRATLCGFAAGSIATFVLGADVDGAAITWLETEGLGERRGEGFGQVLVATASGDGAGPALLTEFVTGPPGTVRMERPTPAPAPPGDRDDEAMLAALRRESWRTKIHDGAVPLASTAAGREQIFGAGVEKVSASQLAILRDVVANLGDPEHARAVVTAFKKQARRPPWPDEVIKATTSLLVEPNRVWDLLGLSAGARGTSGDESQQEADRLRLELRDEAVQAVVLAALTAQRRAREAAGSDADRSADSARGIPAAEARPRPAPTPGPRGARRNRRNGAR